MRLWSRQKLSEKQPPYLFWFKRILAKLKQTIGILKKSPFSRNSVTKKKIVSIPFLCACKNLQACTLILPLSLLRTKANSALNIFVFARGRSTLIAYMIQLKKKLSRRAKKYWREQYCLFGIERVLLDIDVAYYLLLAIFLKIARNLLLNFDAV